jgi:hypothetical protein
MDKEIPEIINRLNEKLAGEFPCKIEIVAPDSIKLLEKNARYMKAEQYGALVANIKRDGGLSSMPLCYRETKEGPLIVLSGNHRIKAAVQAGIERVLVLVVAGEKNKDEQISIQLSHNAISGQDDLSLLKELWESIQSMAEKVYAGLDSETLNAMESIKFSGLQDYRTRYKIVNFMFLPEELQDLDALLKETAIAFAADTVYLANLKTYEAFFDLVVKIKKQCQIKNSAAAFLKLMDLARAGLELLMKVEGAENG